MADGADLRRLALALAGTTEAPHVDRAAFRVDRIFATLAADGLTANLKLMPEEQALKCAVHADAFQLVGNAWGLQGWTTATLAALNEQELSAALAMAWRHAIGKPKRKRADT